MTNSTINADDLLSFDTDNLSRLSLPISSPIPSCSAWAVPKENTSTANSGDFYVQCSNEVNTKIRLETLQRKLETRVITTLLAPMTIDGPYSESMMPFKRARPLRIRFGPRPKMISSKGKLPKKVGAAFPPHSPPPPRPSRSLKSVMSKIFLYE
ncbi:hypothetical protein G6F57_000998 [Rhizopus arrhizus]|uniref:Uncharacterized protein n=1 Tax=Rhizopus oryzae TaxID=64495 RepID=A0A9P6XIL3_RHIOR|nr:hypothetical protein G6F23_004456 [Rhizopus arrhizus]KAG1417573.1 hypothetical protein G6F58_005456 [Rhizopus delemar]KAG0769153.1 hypothetical protein G6F24_001310 [Rhizopus arrhizus]KAG0787652.1 hypothetical protein G6F22_007244 [Rhizopus arrhizus]KAG0795564.1 hypothetical protein G6F21_001999 [Rhizopus arrhizus]